MNPTFTAEFALPDPNDTISSLTDLVNELNNLSLPIDVGPFTGMVISDSTPAVAQQDQIWGQLDNGGRPFAIKAFYQGAWRRFFSGKPNEVTMFTGDPAQFFDNTGLGLTDKEWDGWAICNGNNSTPNLSNLFIVGGQMDNVGITGFNNGWQSNVTGTAAKTSTTTTPSGAASYTLLNNNLPNMKVQLNGKGNFDTNQSPHDEKHAIVTGKWTDTGSGNTIDVQTFGADPTGNPPVPQVAIPTVPPFAVVCYCMWVGIA